ncbi:MAG: FHA domain-containing protein [Anaerolineae bacterium]
MIALAPVGDLSAVRTTELDRPASPTAGTLRVTILESQEIFDIPFGQQILIGRLDLRGNVVPTIDLTDHRGVEMGISRRHAQITFEDGKPQILDLGSTNGTWLEKERLSPYQPHPLSNGDRLTLGNLVMRIDFAPRS